MRTFRGRFPAVLVLVLATILAAPAVAMAVGPTPTPTPGAEARPAEPSPGSAPDRRQPAARRPPRARAHAARGAHDATVSHRFSDVERWKKLFDDPSRDAWQKPEELVKALGVAPGDRVADLGAGTGYFERYLSRAVGERGAVFAADVEPELIAHLRERAEKEKTANVIPVLASFDDPRLPPGGVDLVLLVDTYHHINDRLRYFGELAKTLAPRGRVAVVDFHKRELPVGPSLEHKLAKETVVEEMTEAGYGLDGDLDLLPYQYTLVFRPRPLPGE